MLSLILSTIAIVTPVNSASVSDCVSIVNGSGNTVTVCGGRRTEVRDTLGNVRTYNADGSITVRDASGRSFTI